MPACHAGDRRFESGRVRHPLASIRRPARPPGRGVSYALSRELPADVAASPAPRLRRPRRGRGVHRSCGLTEPHCARGDPRFADAAGRLWLVAAERRRLATLEGWPLRIQPRPGTVPATVQPYAPATAWTLVAGGDINLDGQVAFHVKQLGLGVDFPFAGGTAEITGHTCCSFAGLPLPKARRTGNEGAMHDELSLADLAIPNFENTAPDNFVYHPAGLKFSADPDLIAGLANAGIDWVSLANNHIADFGDQGILDTLQNLDRWGIAHGGAEADLDSARAPSLLQAGGTSVAILGYDTIKAAYGATATSPGSNQMSVARVTADVKAARAAGAGLVIVVPHWGVEYSATTTALQRRLAHAAIDAGADIVIGSHTHWAGGMEVYKGRPGFYSLGDFVFNSTRSEQTEEGIVVELTFAGSRLAQVRLLPYLILDGSQPNLLDPAGSGKVVLKQVFGASAGLPW